MLETILHNLTNIGWAMLIFLCAYLSNVSFSLYYNIKVLLEPFSKEKLRLEDRCFCLRSDPAVCGYYHAAAVCGYGRVGNSD